MNTPEDFTLADEAFQTYVRNHSQFTLEHLSGESLTPELMVITRTMGGKDELTMCCLAVPFNEGDEKRIVLSGLGKKFYDERQVALAVILASEAWMASWVPGSPRVEPRHDPNRKEHVIVVGSGLREHQRLLIATPIRRDEKNEMQIDGEAKEIPTARFPLLEWFWRGYFSAVLPK